ncbi:MAG TPA: hypothetical protein VI356_14960 [Myxococcales bacterium]
MQTFREWAYPCSLVILWIAAAAYTLSLMIDFPRPSQQPMELIAAEEISAF